MLEYFGHGQRDYHTHPVPIYQRMLWEFQAFLRGGAYLKTTSGRYQIPAGTLSVFAPDLAHGWDGDHLGCEVAVFHFEGVPAQIRNIVGAHGWATMKLDADAETVLIGLVEEASREARYPRASSPLRYEKILLEICLLTLRLKDADRGGSQASRNQEKVDEILDWYNSNLHRGPSLTEAARANGVSPAHMRRIFHEVTGLSPKDFLDDLRFRRATDLLEFSDLKVEAIADAVGFNSVSAFSRAFNKRFRQPPSVLRKRMAGYQPGIAWRGNDGIHRGSVRETHGLPPLRNDRP